MIFSIFSTKVTCHEEIHWQLYTLHFVQSFNPLQKFPYVFFNIEKHFWYQKWMNCDIKRHSLLKHRLAKMFSLYFKPEETLIACCSSVRSKSTLDGWQYWFPMPQRFFCLEWVKRVCLWSPTKVSGRILNEHVCLLYILVSFQQNKYW